MSWLSEFLEGQNTTADHNAQVLKDQQAASIAKAAADAKTAADAKAAADAAALQQQQQLAAQQAAADAAAQHAAQVAAAKGGLTSGVNSYFTSRNIDPSKYAPDIDTAISQALSKVDPNTDPTNAIDPAQLASSIYGNEQSTARDAATNQINQLFPANFSTNKIGDNSGDDIVNNILASKRQTASDAINNMLQRGVITNAGANSANTALAGQDATARSTLGTIDTNAIAAGRSKLDSIVNSGKTDAGNLALGSNFDPSVYGKESDDAFNSFIKSLPDTLNSQAGNLYTTVGLGSAAGVGQGAQNTKFDPGALAGVLGTDSSTKTNPTSATNSDTPYVF